MSTRSQSEDYVRMNRNRIHDYDSVNSNTQYYGSTRNRSAINKIMSMISRKSNRNKSYVLMIIIIMILILNLLIFAELTFFGFITYNKLSTLRVKIINQEQSYNNADEVTLNIMKSKIDHILNAVSFRIPQDLRSFVKQYADTMITGKIIEIIRSSKHGLNLDLKIDDSKGLYFRIGSITSTEKDIDELYKLLINESLINHPTPIPLTTTTKRVKYALPEGPPGYPISGRPQALISENSIDLIKLRNTGNQLNNSHQNLKDQENSMKQAGVKPTKIKQKIKKQTKKRSKKKKETKQGPSIGSHGLRVTSLMNSQNSNYNIVVKFGNETAIDLVDFINKNRNKGNFVKQSNVSGSLLVKKITNESEWIMGSNMNMRVNPISRLGSRNNNNNFPKNDDFLLFDKIPLKGSKKKKRIKHYKFCANYLRGRQRIIKNMLKWIRLIDSNVVCSRYKKLSHMIRN